MNKIIITLLFLISSAVLAAQGWVAPPNQKYLLSSQIEMENGSLINSTSCGKTRNDGRIIGTGGCKLSSRQVAFTYNKRLANAFQLELNLDYAWGWSGVWLVPSRNIAEGGTYKWNYDKNGSYYVARNSSNNLIVMYVDGEHEVFRRNLDSELLRRGTIFIERNENGQISVSVKLGANSIDLWVFNRDYSGNMFLVGDNQCNNDGSDNWIRRTNLKFWFD